MRHSLTASPTISLASVRLNLFIATCLLPLPPPPCQTPAVRQKYPTKPMCPADNGPSVQTGLSHLHLQKKTSPPSMPSNAYKDTLLLLLRRPPSLPLSLWRNSFHRRRAPLHYSMPTSSANVRRRRRPRPCLHQILLRSQTRRDIAKPRPKPLPPTCTLTTPPSPLLPTLLRCSLPFERIT